MVTLDAGRRSIEEIERAVSAVFAGAGLPAPRGEAMARQLTRAEAMGRATHGLRLVEPYIGHLADGRMRAVGEPEVVVDTGATRVLDSDRLPGLWLAEQVVTDGMRRADDFGVSVTAVRRSHHIGCLGGLALTASRAGYLALIAASGPRSSTVVAHGGADGVLSPNPFAVAVPGAGDGILIDISASVTSMSAVEQHRAAGTRMARPLLSSADGEVTDDPAAVAAGGGILPLGGREDGHKGTALALLVEALTQGLAGWGRADAPAEQASAVTVQVFAPGAFSGLDALTRQMDHTAGLIAASRPVDPARPPRVPGHRALAALRTAERDGLVVGDELAASLSRASRANA